jgi:hypothetical protein
MPVEALPRSQFTLLPDRCLIADVKLHRGREAALFHCAPDMEAPARAAPPECGPQATGPDAPL